MDLLRGKKPFQGSYCGLIKLKLKLNFLKRLWLNFYILKTNSVHPMFLNIIAGSLEGEHHHRTSSVGRRMLPFSIYF